MGDNWEVDDTGRLTKGKVGGYAQVVGVTVTPSTTSTSWVLLPDMQISSFNVVGGIVLVMFSAEVRNNTAGEDVRVRLRVDGSAIAETQRRFTSATANQRGNVAFTYIVTGLTPGNHSFEVQWRVSGGTGRADSTRRNLDVMEVMM